MRRTFPILLVGSLVVAALASCSGSSDTSAPATTANRADDPRPNILVVMTDDQTLESLRVMTNVKRDIADQGTTFDTFEVSFPTCCPSRATYLTGQYAHNHGVKDNILPDGGWSKLGANETLPVWLQRAGYRTGHVGKYLNGWGTFNIIDTPPGWDDWFGLIDPSTYRYFGYSVSVNGEKREYGTAPEDYQTDVLVGEVQRQIRADDGRPWFISFTPLAPHPQFAEKAAGSGDQPSEDDKLPQPAPRHAQSFSDEPIPRPPSFDQVDVSGLPKDVAARTRLSPADIDLITSTYRHELGSLLAVDEGVGAIVDTLRETGQLDNTVILFTSDQGAFHGEHRIRMGKYYLYEPATRVPLLIRGPGFPAGLHVDDVASNVDLAPTIVSLAGATPGVAVDGVDLGRVVRDPSLGSERGVLLENFNPDHPTSRAIRTARWFYAEHSTGERELYDLEADPDQVVDLAGRPDLAEVQAQLAARLQMLASCAGATCEGLTG